MLSALTFCLCQFCRTLFSQKEGEVHGSSLPHTYIQVINYFKTKRLKNKEVKLLKGIFFVDHVLNNKIQLYFYVDTKNYPSCYNKEQLLGMVAHNHDPSLSYTVSSRSA